MIPADRAFPPKAAPLFFGGGSGDQICLSVMGQMAMKDESLKDHNVTIRDYDADHWLIWSKGDEIAQDLENWIQNVVLKV